MSVPTIRGAETQVGNGNPVFPPAAGPTLVGVDTAAQPNWATRRRQLWSSSAIQRRACRRHPESGIMWTGVILNHRNHDAGFRRVMGLVKPRGTT